MRKSSHQLSYVLHTDGHRPYCSCGWYGEGYETEKDAQVVGWHHQHQTTPRAKRKTHPVAWIMLIAFGACGVAVANSDGTSSSSSSGEPSADSLKYGAFDVCTSFVKDRLKAPSTADFPNPYSRGSDVSMIPVTYEQKPGYVVRSHVDAQNGFGAQIRSDFACTVTHEGGERWRLVNLDLD